MIRLEPVSEKSIRDFEHTSYSEMSDEEKLLMIRESLGQEHDGAYYELLAVLNGSRVVGFISLYAHSEHIISVSPEIKPAFRRKGFGYLGEQMALAYAKESGYTVASASVREDNGASIALHEKLGFEQGASCLSRSGRPIRIYIKRL